MSSAWCSEILHLAHVHEIVRSSANLETDNTVPLNIPAALDIRNQTFAKRIFVYDQKIVP